MNIRQWLRKLLRKLKKTKVKKEPTSMPAAPSTLTTSRTRTRSSGATVTPHREDNNVNVINVPEDNAAPPPISREPPEHRHSLGSERLSLSRFRGPRWSGADEESGRNRRNSAIRRSDSEPQFLYSPGPSGTAGGMQPLSIKRLSAIGPAPDDVPGNIRLTRTRSEGDDTFDDRLDIWQPGAAAQRISMRSELMSPPSRTLTENTMASSDYENHSTTHSLGPSPVPAAQACNASGSDILVSPLPKPERQVQCDGIDAFYKSPELSGIKRLPTIENPLTAGAPDSPGLEESLFIKRFNKGKRKGLTERRTKTHRAVYHEKFRRVEREERTKVVTREHHYHHVVPKIQPIVDREYLPAKHYLQSKRGSLREIPPGEAALYGEPIWRGEQVVAADDKVEDVLGVERHASLNERRDAEGNRVDSVVDGLHDLTVGSRPGLATEPSHMQLPEPMTEPPSMQLPEPCNMPTADLPWVPLNPPERSQEDIDIQEGLRKNSSPTLGTVYQDPVKIPARPVSSDDRILNPRSAQDMVILNARMHESPSPFRAPFISAENKPPVASPPVSTGKPVDGVRTDGYRPNVSAEYSPRTQSPDGRRDDVGCSGPSSAGADNQSKREDGADNQRKREDVAPQAQATAQEETHPKHIKRWSRHRLSLFFQHVSRRRT